MHMADAMFILSYEEEEEKKRKRRQEELEGLYSMEKKYVFVLTYNFDSDIFAESFDGREEAEERLNAVLEEELDTVRRECGFGPVVITQDSGDVELIYTSKEKWEQAVQEGNGQQRVFDAARYLIVEI